MKACSKNGKPICLKHPTDKYEVETIPLQNGKVSIVSYSDGTIVINVQENKIPSYMWCNKAMKECDIQDSDDYISVEVVK